jgi:hypothetical protein
MRLEALRPLVVDRLLEVVDPRLKVLEATPPAFRAVRIRVVDAPGRTRLLRLWTAGAARARPTRSPPPRLV